MGEAGGHCSVLGRRRCPHLTDGQDGALQSGHSQGLSHEGGGPPPGTGMASTSWGHGWTRGGVGCQSQPQGHCPSPEPWPRGEERGGDWTGGWGLGQAKSDRSRTSQREVLTAPWRVGPAWPGGHPWGGGCHGGCPKGSQVWRPLQDGEGTLSRQRGQQERRPRQERARGLVDVQLRVLEGGALGRGLPRPGAGRPCGPLTSSPGLRARTIPGGGRPWGKGVGGGLALDDQWGAV